MLAPGSSSATATSPRRRPRERSRSSPARSGQRDRVVLLGLADVRRPVELRRERVAGDRELADVGAVGLELALTLRVGDPQPLTGVGDAAAREEHDLLRAAG